MSKLHHGIVKNIAKGIWNHVNNKFVQAVSAEFRGCPEDDSWKSNHNELRKVGSFIYDLFT